MKCFACGAEKDLSVKVVYPYDNDSLTQEMPIEQLLVVECQGKENRPDGSWDFRAAIMCHECFHDLSQNRGIDMWIGQECWEFLKPVIPFAKLPAMAVDESDKRWEAESYG